MKIFITGTPHSGKTAFFEQIASGQGSPRHYLQGSDLYAHYFSTIWQNETLEFLDFPGFADRQESSEAAQVFQKALQQEKPDRIVQVISNQNFESQLQSLLKVLEWGIPVVLVAHTDHEFARDHEIDWQLLSETFQTAVHPSRMSRKKIQRFFENIIHAGKPRLTQRQKEHSQELLAQLATPIENKPVSRSKIFSESFFKHWAFFPISTLCLIFLLIALNKLILGVYGLWMERTFLGHYLHSFLDWLLGSVGISGWVRDLVVGNYGLLTLGVAYGLAFVYPVLAFTYLILNLLIESQYLEHLKVWFLGLLKNLHLPESYFHIGLTGLGCNLVAIQNIKNMPSPSQKFLGLIFLMLGVPCAAQSLILGNVLLGINPFLLIVFLILILAQAGIWGLLLARRTHAPQVTLIIEPKPLRIPDYGWVIKKSWRQLSVAITTTLPLLLLSALVLSLMDSSGVLNWLRQMVTPFLGFAFGLPPETTDIFLIGFFRRDFGAVGLYNLTNQGNLNSVQTLVILSLLTFFYPCFASFLSVARNFSRKIALQLFGFLCLYNLLLASALNWILNL